jgi:Fe-S cluster biosynthesis and repair protein YggX
MRKPFAGICVYLRKSAATSSFRSSASPLVSSVAQRCNGRPPLFCSCYNIHMPRMVKCAKLGRELPGLDEPPFDTELGQKIYENVSAEAWKMWAEHSKMLLNEYRLQPWKPEAQQFLVEQMQQYFFGQGAQLPKEFVPPPK